jgi:DNA recombination protein RmuC
MVVRLPGGRVIPIDSKVPLDSYLASTDAGRTDEERAALRQAHADAVRSHVRALASKNYAAETPGDIEFTVLYMELESAFTAAFETDPSIHEEAMRKRVLVVTPSTLLALLRTVAMHWSNSEVTDKAAQIRDEAKELVERVGVLVKHLNTAGQRLGSTVDAFNKAVGSFDRMFVPQLNKVASIVALPEVKVEDGPMEAPRRVTRPELEVGEVGAG